MFGKWSSALSAFSTGVPEVKAKSSQRKNCCCIVDKGMNRHGEKTKKIDLIREEQILGSLNCDIAVLRSRKREPTRQLDIKDNDSCTRFSCHWVTEGRLLCLEVDTNET